MLIGKSGTRTLFGVENLIQESVDNDVIDGTSNPRTILVEVGTVFGSLFSAKLIALVILVQLERNKAKWRK